ncbi:MAG TPA: prepilin-type N-terminal cleavage/methylation domain-containing protein [Candidatus Omnitrophota bacterium]|nr:prepilin-type N-terminal cleavage/methylation domain-containing protein [Candidatus Omnitrophota bacterium]
MRRKGFTLIELLVIFAIIAVAAGYFSFRFSGFLDRIKLSSAARAVVADLRAGQADALSRHAEVEFRFDRRDYTRDGLTRKLPSGVEATAPSQIVFGATGLPEPGKFGTITFSCGEGTVSIVISSSGRIRTE